MSMDNMVEESVHSLMHRIHMLPADIQAILVSYLPRNTRQVLFIEVPNLRPMLMLNKKVWNTLELESPQLTHRQALKLLDKVPNYTSLIIRKRKDLNKIFKMLIKWDRCKDLKSIYLDNCVGSNSAIHKLVSSKLLKDLFDACVELRELKLCVAVDLDQSQLVDYLSKLFIKLAYLECEVLKCHFLKFLSLVEGGLVMYDGSTLKDAEEQVLSQGDLFDPGSFVIQLDKDFGHVLSHSFVDHS